MQALCLVRISKNTKSTSLESEGVLELLFEWCGTKFQRVGIDLEPFSTYSYDFEWRFDVNFNEHNNNNIIKFIKFVKHNTRYIVTARKKN